MKLRRIINEETLIDTSIKFTNKYTVEYKGNGGIWNNTDTWSNTATYGSDYKVENNFYTRTGYTFIGWTTKTDNTDDGYNWTGWSGVWKCDNGQYGTKNYYCSLTQKYTSSKPSCTETVSVSSSTTYSCPEGYTSSDKKITSSSICSKTEAGDVTEVGRSYYSCSLFSDKEYSTEAKAKTACTNYCSNSSTKYYSGKDKCIGLSG